MTDCLSDTQLSRVVDGVLRCEEQTAVEDHLDQCEECRSLIIAYLKAMSDDPESGELLP